MPRNAGIIIILASIIFPTTLIITYTISLHNRHIIPVLPYISHTGNDQSESCFFSLGVNIVAGLYASITFLRYAQIQEHIKTDPKTTLTQLNASSLAWGMIASFTLSSTACFQQRNTGFLHISVAVVCSYSALVFFWHQTVISIYSGWISKTMRKFRLVLSVLSTILHLFAPVIYLYSTLNHTLPEGKVTEWADNQKAIAFYNTGSFMEWFVLIFNILYTASFYKEFTKIKVKIGEIIIDGQHFL